MTEQKVATKKKASVGSKIVLLVVVLAIIAAVGLYFYPVQQPLVSPFKDKDVVVVATIGDEPVSMDELEAFKATVPQLKDLPMETVYKQLVEAYVNKKLILAQAQKMGLQDDAQVKRVLKDAEDQLLIRAYIEKKIADEMTPEALQTLYTLEMQHFEPQEEVRARHILVATEKEARDLIVKLRAGADFATLANKYTLDRNQGGTNGGDLGYFTKEMMIPEFAKEAFSLPKGQFSKKPLKTAFGWHVVKVEDKRKSAPPTFEQMLEPLQARFIEVAAPRIIAKERAAANVQIKDLYPEQKAQEAVVEETAEEVAEDPMGEDVIEEATDETVAEPAEEGELLDEDAVAVDVEVTP
ncbi:MAG: peptidylprolyl isomerase [Alphaproteobacteria bacterium]|nr:peptidylprolyl isomerase [Alphaproteobacteria bacterium]